MSDERERDDQAEPAPVEPERPDEFETTAAPPLPERAVPPPPRPRTPPEEAT